MGSEPEEMGDISDPILMVSETIEMGSRNGFRTQKNGQHIMINVTGSGTINLGSN